MNENVRIWINISLKFVPKGLTNNISALVQIMAWRRPGDKPLSEPMMVNLLTHICITRPQWVNQQRQVITSPVRCGIELLIHSQTSMTAPLEVWEWIGYFIPHFIMNVFTYPFTNMSIHVSKKSHRHQGGMGFLWYFLFHFIHNL